MPPGTRIRDNNVFGTTTDNPLTIGAAVMNSTELSLLSTVVAGDHAIITLDPLRINGAPEIIVVTAHGVGATSASITRGAYGTVARAHPLGTQWVHAPVTEDVTKIVTSGTRPTDPYRGQKIFETDTNRYIGRTTADTWQQEGLFFDPPHCGVRHSATQVHTNNGGWFTMVFDTEDEDTAIMHDNITNNSRITVPITGLYAVTAAAICASSGGAGIRHMGLRANGSGTNAPNIKGRQGLAASAAGDNALGISATVKLTANTYIEVVVFQNSGGNMNILASTGEAHPYFTVTWIGRGN